jgi:hypothetical protein
VAETSSKAASKLCQMITRTFLDYWNRESGRKMFSSDEVPLAEQLLGNLAYSIHGGGTLLTAYDVRTTTRHTLTTFYHRQPGEITQGEITQFIETLRRSSGLFVEGGEGLFYYASRTIQDYYVLEYLLHMPQEELKQFALQHYQLLLWRAVLATWYIRSEIATVRRSVCAFTGCKWVCNKGKIREREHVLTR